jgi:hypothetical protein
VQQVRVVKAAAPREFNFNEKKKGFTQRQKEDNPTPRRKISKKPTEEI